MGIPFFFHDIVTKNRNVLTSVSSCDRLFLDYNSIIHTCSAQVMAEHSSFPSIEERNRRIFQKITEYTKFVVESCTPTRLLYIAIDGVAPLAKMNQQRKRRHMTAYRNECLREFKDKHHIPYADWDSNCITPGTLFMEELNTYLHAYYQAHLFPFQVIVSGPFEQGEGEHKIMQYIKQQTCAQEDEIQKDRYKDVIYGLDADLIMLSLTCCKQNIFLMRESQHFGNKALSNGFQYVHIDRLRKYVSQYLYQKEDEEYMLDYVFICFLLGNDFLPHPFVMSIKHGGVDLLCESYREVHKETGKFCVQKDADGRFQIQMDVFRKLLKSLASQEDARMKDLVKHYMEAPFFDRPNRNPLEKFTQELDTMPMRQRKKLIDPEHDPLWRNSYFYHLLRINPYTERKQVDDVCQSFLCGLVWNVNYYFNGIYSHDWFYAYPFAPPLRDLSNYVEKSVMMDPNPMPGMPGTPITITPEEQLVLVLPLQSKQLVPPRLRRLYEDPSYGCIHFFPKTFRIETFLKTQLWECTPILPVLNIPYIQQKIQHLR